MGLGVVVFGFFGEVDVVVFDKFFKGEFFDGIRVGYEN